MMMHNERHQGALSLAKSFREAAQFSRDRAETARRVLPENVAEYEGKAARYENLAAKLEGFAYGK